MKPGSAQGAPLVLLAEHGLRAVLSALLAWWMARQLGPADFGWLSLASAMAAIGFVLMGLGLDLPLVLRLARGRPAHTLLAATLLWRGAAALCVMVLAGAAAWGLQPDDAPARAVLWVVMLSVPAYVPCTLDLPFRACNRVVPLALARGAATLIAAAAKAVALLAGAPLLVLAGLVAAEAALASLLVAHRWWALARVARARPTSQAGASVWQRASGPLRRGARAMRRLGRPLLARGLPQMAAALAAAAHLKAELLVLAVWGTALAAGAAGVAGMVAGDAGDVGTLALGAPAVDASAGTAAGPSLPVPVPAPVVVGPETLGHYALAQKFAEVLLLLPVLALDAALPALARLAPVGAHRPAAAGGPTHADARATVQASAQANAPADSAADTAAVAAAVAAADAAANAAAQRLFDTAVTAAGLSALAVWAMAPLLVPRLFGPDYANAVPLMQWLGLAAAGMALDGARRRWLAWQGLQHLAWRLSLGGLLLAVALAAWWVPLAGAEGAALAAVVSWWLPALAAPYLAPAARPLGALQRRALWPWGRWWALWQQRHPAQPGWPAPARSAEAVSADTEAGR